jgi:hypothetical protein
LKYDGTATLNRVASGVTTYNITPAVAWTALAIGQTIPLRVNLTATSITVTRTDNGNTITVTDTTFPRTGFVSVFGQGIVPGVGQTRIAYDAG